VNEEKNVAIGEDIEQTTAYAEKALVFMKDQKIAASPNNFTIWFSYVSENFSDLSRTLDVLLSNNQEFDDEKNKEIFDKFFTKDDDAALVQAASEKVEGEISHIMDMLGDASGAVRSYGDSLKTGMGTIAQNASLENLKDVMNNLLIDTQRLHKANEDLHQNLRKSGAEISHLRQNLEVVRKESLTDALTGLANRKMFDEELRKGVMNAMEEGSSYCVAMTDIDFFKKFNDTYGHQTGDQVLKLVAQILSGNVKGKDLAARYGGEEFILLLPDTELDQAQMLCEKIRLAVSSKRIRDKKSGQDMGNITLSIGISKHRPGEKLNEFIHRADEGLYFAKGNGRNQTVLETQLLTIDAAE
jgi:diguanylate cyclase